MESGVRHLMRQREKGVSLVEALVALVVLSIGMLGIAGLFVESLRNSRTALLRTQAINLATDMGDRIRANANARAAYDMGAYGDAPASRNCSPTSADAGDNCGVDELAEDDLARWRAAVGFALPPPGDATIPADVEFLPAADSGRPDRYRITIAWQEPTEPQPYTYISEVVVMPRPPIS